MTSDLVPVTMLWVEPQTPLEPPHPLRGICAPKLRRVLSDTNGRPERKRLYG
jgi:hypothetical protein